MRRNGGRPKFLIALAIGLCAAWGGPTAAAASAQPIVASVGGTPSGSAMPPGFVGVSLEYGALHVYTGRNSAAVNPVLLNLLAALAPGQSPVIRIGGDSSDQTWWPMRGVIPPGGIRYPITADWLRVTRALAEDLNARLIMGVNLAAGRPALAAAEAQAFLQGVGRRYVQALEIGNEPDVYNVFPWYRNARGVPFYARGPGYNMSDLTHEFSRFAAAMPRTALAGPAFAEETWLSDLNGFISSEPELRTVTLHRYPLRAGVTDPASPAYPSFANLLSDRSSSQLAQGIAPYVNEAHAAGLMFRVDEMNSAANKGQRGLSDTFASALWVLDTLFNLAKVGVDGVNLHTLPGARYELFTFSHSGSGWSAFVHPEYYGMLMFAQAFGPGARLLPVSAPQGPVKVWATRGADDATRVVIINKDAASNHLVSLTLSEPSGPASLDWLGAPSVSSTTGVTLGGQSFGARTTSGKLPPARRSVISSTSLLNSSYTIDLPPASAVLLTR